MAPHVWTQVLWPETMAMGCPALCVTQGACCQSAPLPEVVAGHSVKMASVGVLWYSHSFTLCNEKVLHGRHFVTL